MRGILIRTRPPQILHIPNSSVLARIACALVVAYLESRWSRMRSRLLGGCGGRSRWPWIHVQSDAHGRVLFAARDALGDVGIGRWHRGGFLFWIVVGGRGG